MDHIVIHDCILICLCSQFDFLFLSLPAGVRNSSSTTCGCKMFPATGRDSSLSTAVSSPTSPKKRTTAARLSTDPARRSYKRETQQDQGSCSGWKLQIMNVITAPQHMVSSQATLDRLSLQELHLQGN